MYKAPSCGHALVNLNLPFKMIVRRFELRLFSDAWNENAALFERLMEINSNPLILWL